MKLSVEEARWLLMGDLEGWETLDTLSEGKGRWELYYTTIVKHLESGKCYSLDWSRGATEQQDTRPFEWDEPKLVEVEPYEEVVVKWRKINV